MTDTVIAVSRRADEVLAEVERAVVGRRAALRLIFTAVLAGGHVLIEDLPGLGKTLIARSFAAALGLDFTRVQFTPDLLPADLLGSTIYDMVARSFEFRPGPIFTQLLLADEINRTPPKTQAALDRFAIRARLGYLDQADEAAMLRRRLDRGAPVPTVGRVIDAGELLAMQAAVERVSVDADLLAYVVALARATRRHAQVEVGASPRAELDLVQLARAAALLAGRDYVIPDDVKGLAVAAISHRIGLRPEMWVRRVSADDIVGELLRRVPVPRTPE
ncbi:AAA family ATPase [Skermania piniformis]|uniref:MoxR family ATPase n=1 Tax=Skermania pinensis TaxID=39122 RepID=A0ABX8S847_9ACTN|nr:MoxR family ATPase [Skermania piniformis]QXQ13987.1 MoxR family ATPase [Skermania piniformis]